MFIETYLIMSQSEFILLWLWCRFSMLTWLSAFKVISGWKFDHLRQVFWFSWRNFLNFKLLFLLLLPFIFMPFFNFLFINLCFNLPFFFKFSFLFFVFNLFLSYIIILHLFHGIDSSLSFKFNLLFFQLIQFFLLLFHLLFLL